MVDPRVAGGRAAHLGPSRRRPQILDVATRLFRRHGYEGTSMEMIARAARVTRPVVYTCYPSKRELFRALLDREERRLLQQIMAALPSRPRPDDPAGMLSDGFTGVLTAASVAPESWGLIFLAPHTSPEVASRVERARNQVRAGLADLAEPMLASRGVEDPDGDLAELVAHLLMGNAEAGVRLMLARPERWSPQSLGPLIGHMVAPALDVLAAGHGAGARRSGKASAT